VSFLLATLTYYLIEKKIRHHKSKWTLPILVTLFILTGIAGWLISCRVIPAREIPDELVKCDRAIRDRNSFEGLRWMSKSSGICLNEIGGSGFQTLFYGDSNTQQYAPRIIELLKNNKKKQRGAILLSAGGVSPFPNVTKINQLSSREMEVLFNKIITDNTKVDRVVISARWDLYFNENNDYRFNGIKLSDKSGGNAALSAFGSMINNLKRNNKTVIVVLSTPNGESLNPKSFYKRKFFGTPNKTTVKQTAADFLNKNGDILQKLTKVARTNGAEVIDPMDYLCTNGVCISENEDGPIRYDGNHLRPGYVRDHVKYLDQTVAP
jgi:hypothetical protein